MKLRIIPYFLSQYVWIIIISLPLLSIVITPRKVTTKDFFSQARTSPFNDSEIPTWFLHGTDLHVSSTRKGSYENILNQLNRSINLLKPKKIILTGDLVDNKDEGAKRPYTYQHENDWNAYKKLLAELNLTGDSRLVQVAGNHDIYDLISYDSKHHYANNTLYNFSDFQMKRIPLDIPGITASILAINPFQFPTPPIDLTWFTSPKYGIIKNVTNEIINNNDDIQILAHHHPALMWYPNNGMDSSSSYAQYLKRTSNVRMILCGHRHPEHPVFQHFGDVLEVIGTPWLFYNDRVGLITYDNRRITYHEVDITKDHVAVMTAPSPVKQVSGLDIFSERKTRIRALYFGETPGNLSVRGSANGKLNCNRQIEESVWLCTMEAEFSNGYHNLTMVGDWEGNISFTVNPTVRGFDEQSYLTEHSIAYTFLFAWFLIVSIVITLPVNFSTVGSQAEQWIIGKNNNSHWMFAIFGGFILVRNRLYNSPKFIKLGAILATIWPLILPLNVFALDKKPAMYWSWGYVANAINIFQFEGQQFAVWYLYFVVLGFAFISSSIKATFCLSWVFAIDLLVYLGTLAGCSYYAYKTWSWFGLGFALTSPCFVLIPIVLLVFTIIFVMKSLKGRETRNNELFDKSLVE
ncbi:metallo-dependent phosphatases family [Trichomonas vaginalis G3]|uniref:metallo-dependent phosphatases family n=1 Tax=Trichomonas vaginalis (strain ATCC PRA-98 / G3) TaxID=412133 RepID=UPI0021E5BCD5|nr:metallo-dependent phosphatases family [Trichomonas vaginalis G3]KAI5500546.1 metallo-dependent phosphatases family [Trichomonas vaginalis G3]